MDCGAKAKRTGLPCRSPAMSNGRCRIHGGKSLAGISSPRTTTGRYSKHLPTRMGERYQQALTDPELLAMREEVALLDARLSDVLGRVDSGESGAAWALLKTQFADYRKAKPGPDRDIALSMIEDTIKQGLDDYAAWEEVRSLVDQRARIVASERQRLVQMQQMLSTEQAMTLIAAVADSVRRHVDDRGVLAAISADLGRLLSHRTAEQAQPAARE